MEEYSGLGMYPVLEVEVVVVEEERIVMRMMCCVWMHVCRI